MIHIEYFIFNPFQERCSVVWDCNGNCAVIDPGFYDITERDALYGFIQKKGLTPVCIMLTHGHFDHTFGLAELASYYGIPVYMNEADKVILDIANRQFCEVYGLRAPAAYGTDVAFRFIKEGDSIEVGDLRFEVIETPGHTPGGVCYLEREEKVLFSGDTLFAGAIGRTDNQWGDYDALMAGILGKLMTYDGDIAVIPGHGPDTDIATERMTNPFLQPFNNEDDLQ